MRVAGMRFRFYKTIITVLAVSLMGAVSAEPAPGGDSLEQGMVNPGYHEKPNWFKQSFLDLRDDVAEASDSGKQVILYFYQDGCPYCKKLLEDNFGQKRISDKTQEQYDLIAINMWGDRLVTDMDGNEITEKDFAKQQRVMFTPTMLVLDPEGERRFRINGYYPPDKFIAALDYNHQQPPLQQRFRDYYSEQTKVKASGQLHDQGFIKKTNNISKLMDKSNNLLMVLFEQEVCLECDELHLDLFKKEEVIVATQPFDVVQVDMRSSTPYQIPGRDKPITAQDWANELNVQYAPTMVFFELNDDGELKELFRSEAYLRTFHVVAIMEYVSTGAYKEQPEFQRFVQAKADRLHEQGIEYDLMQ